MLTASTSDAYSLLFKLLADAGDEVLVPRPSYPLFDHLTRLDLVVPRPYDLDVHGSWSIDFASVERALTPRTRAVLVVSPNNPTGSFVSAAELDRLAALCAPREIAIIADEVFADYELEPGASRRAGRAAARRDVLSFALGGLSKSVGLPQVKLGWIAAGGPDALVDGRARAAGAGVRHLSRRCRRRCRLAAADLLDRGAVVRSQIAARVATNYRELMSLCRPHAVVRCPAKRWRVVCRDAGAVVRAGRRSGRQAADERRRARRIPATSSTSRASRSSSSASCRPRRRSATASRASCGTLLAARPRHECSDRPAPGGPAHPAVLVSVHRKLGHRRHRRCGTRHRVAGVCRPARVSAPAAQRDGAGPAVAVLGDQRDGDRSDLHPRAGRARVRGARRRGGAVARRSRRARRGSRARRASITGPSGA